jgi:hypothetical protein
MGMEMIKCSACGREIGSHGEEGKHCRVEIGRKRRTSATKIGLILFGGTAGFALILEIALRTIFGLGSPVLFETDSSFGSYPRANQHLHRFFADISTNQYGMRSTYDLHERKNGEYRILFVGDSVPFGLTYVDQRDIFVERIGTSLRGSENPHAIALNASSPGWAPSNELGFLKSRGIYGADMVVMVYNTKDLTQRFSPYHESPLVPLQNPPSATSELWQRYVIPRFFPATLVVDSGSTTFDGQPSPADEAGVMETIEATRQLVASQGAQFVILFSPVFTEDVRRYQSGWNQALANLKHWSVERGVAILDMTDVVTVQNAAAMYFDGVHLRPAGNQLYADAFVNWFSHRQRPVAASIERN